MNNIEEILNCVDDVGYFANNYIQHINIDVGWKQFSSYKFQDILLNYMHSIPYKKDVLVGLLPRQMGKTLLEIIYLIYYVTFNNHKNIIFCGYKGIVLDRIITNFLKSYEKLPEFLKKDIVKDDKHNINIGNNKISFVVANYVFDDDCEDEKIDLGIFDECFLNNGISKFEKIIILSTKNIKKESFGDNCYMVKINWWEHPYHDIEWKNSSVQNLTETVFGSEYDNRG